MRLCAFGRWLAALNCALWATGAGPSAPVGPIQFEDIAARAGVQFLSDSSPTDKKNQPETMVAGDALFDYDGDGLLDIYLVNGAKMPSLVKDGPQYKNRLFHNNGNLTFTDVTDTAGVAGAGYGMGVAIGDYDNDGRPDIYVANVTGNQLFRNNGDGTFTDVTVKAGVAGGTFNGKKMWSVAAAWVDYNNDGLLDLFVSNYCQWEPDAGPACVVNGHRSYCSPRYYKELPNTLYRNNGDGTFTDVSVETGIAKHAGRGMGIGIADYDGDGYQDIFVANDNAPGQLFHNVGGKYFDEVAADAMVAYSGEGNVVSGMGVGFADVLNKGLPALWVTAVEHETFPLFFNLGKGQFSDETVAAGLGMQTAQMSGWSNGIVDLDNDGWKDLIVARSNVLDNIALFAPRKYEEPNAVFRNLGNGKFQNVSPGAGKDFQLAAAHRGLAYGDLDNDGRMDVVVTVLNGPTKVLHNVTRNTNHWLTLQLVGTRSNRMAIGAEVKLTAENGFVEYNHVSTSTGYASSSDPRVHFGLGSAAAARLIEIKWPSGKHQILRGIKGDQVVSITEEP